MRPVRLTINAVGDSQWVPIDFEQAPVNVALAVCPWSTATGLTYTVQHTLDTVDWTYARGVTITRAGAVATVTDLGPDGLGHGLVTGDNVIIKGSGSTSLDTPGPAVGNGDIGADITVTSNTTYTYACPNSGSTSSNGFSRCLSLRVFNCDISTLVAASTRLDGNYSYPVRAIRLKVSALTGGAVEFLVNQGGR